MKPKEIERYKLWFDKNIEWMMRDWKNGHYLGRHSAAIFASAGMIYREQIEKFRYFCEKTNQKIGLKMLEEYDCLLKPCQK